MKPSSPRLAAAAAAAAAAEPSSSQSFNASFSAIASSPASFDMTPSWAQLLAWPKGLPYEAVEIVRDNPKSHGAFDSSSKAAAAAAEATPPRRYRSLDSKSAKHTYTRKSMVHRHHRHHHNHHSASLFSSALLESVDAAYDRWSPMGSPKVKFTKKADLFGCSYSASLPPTPLFQLYRRRGSWPHDQEQEQGHATPTVAATAPGFDRWSPAEDAATAGVSSSTTPTLPQRPSKTTSTAISTTTTTTSPPLATNRHPCRSRRLSATAHLEQAMAKLNWTEIESLFESKPN